MRVLLDGNLPRTLAALLPGHRVETVHQLQGLRDLGCDKAQGYLISRPVPAEAMRSTMVALDELTGLALFANDHGERMASIPERWLEPVGSAPARNGGSKASRVRVISVTTIERFARPLTVRQPASRSNSNSSSAERADHTSI